MRVAASLVLCLLVLLLPSAAYSGGIPPKTLKDLKAAAVYIKMQFLAGSKANPVTGSGFLIHVENGAGFIATNNHVVSPVGGEVPQGNPKVVFWSGTPNELTVEAHIVARDQQRDLAILKIAAFKDLPKPIPMDLSIEPLETLPVYALGFPFGKDLALGKSNPALTITKGTISSLRYDNRGQVQLVQIDAEINPGNSGGPIVDEKGRLVGVAVSKIVKARTVGFAIPLKPLADMLQGRVDFVVFNTLWAVKNQAEVYVEAVPIDPLGKLKDPALHYRLADKLTEEEAQALMRPGKDGKFAPLKEANSLWLHLTRLRAQGRFSLKGTGPDQVRIAYQTSYVTAAGETVYSPVHFANIDFTRVVHSEQLMPGDPKGPNGNPQLVFTHPMKAGKFYVLQMHADPKNLDPRVMIQDAAGKMLAEDDGSGGLFDAIVAFAPPQDGEYQIVATSTRGMGPFTLQIRADSARDVGKPGPKGVTLPGTLRDNDSLDRIRLVPHQFFNLLLRKGKDYIIDVKSKEFDPLVRLENMANVQVKGEDIGGNGHSTIYFSPLQDGIYRLVVTAFDSQTGRFEVSIREAPPAKLYEIGFLGLKLSGVLTNFDPLDVVNGRSTNFRCKIYPVKLTAKQKIQVNLTSNQFDPVLRIEDQRGKELAFDDDSGGFPNARLVFTAPADGIYRIIATQYDNRVGGFELQVTNTK